MGVLALPRTGIFIAFLPSNFCNLEWDAILHEWEFDFAKLWPENGIVRTPPSSLFQGPSSENERGKMEGKTANCGYKNTESTVWSLSSSTVVANQKWVFSGQPFCLVIILYEAYNINAEISTLNPKFHAFKMSYNDEKPSRDTDVPETSIGGLFSVDFKR